MSAPATPRELVSVLVDVDERSVTVTFDLGDPYDVDVAPDYFMYGLVLVGDAGRVARRFGVKFGPDKTTAHIFDVASTTQSNYDASHVTDRGSSVVVHYVDAPLGVEVIDSVLGFASVEGEDVAVDVPGQIL